MLINLLFGESYINNIIRGMAFRARGLFRMYLDCYLVSFLLLGSIPWYGHAAVRLIICVEDIVIISSLGRFTDNGPFQFAAHRCDKHHDQKQCKERVYLVYKF